jgi:hypothetical protein
MTAAPTGESQVPRLAEEVRSLYAEDPSQALQRVQELLATRLGGYSPAEGRAVIQRLIEHFRPVQNEPGVADSEIMTRVFGLILGRKVAPGDLTSHELLERLAQSLNTIFDALNELIGCINQSFSGGAESGGQTIRQFIGFHLEGEDRTRPLEDYLGRINQAFLTTHEAFKTAARTKVEQIIQALDPEKMAAERGGGLMKIGTLRKAQDFDMLKEKIERIQRWFDSGRFMEDFLREFEKNCQALTRK